MAAAYTKAAKRRAKKRARELARATGLPELAPSPRRAAQGKRRMREIESEKESRIPIIQARCRQNGKDPENGKDRRDMKAPWNGCHAGQAMACQVVDHSERLELWDSIQHIRRTWAQFDAAIGAPQRHARCLRLLLPTEAIETDADASPPDNRTDDEKYRQAISAKMAIEGWLGYVESHAASICKRVVIDDAICRDRSTLVRALRCVADGIKGRKVVYRGVDKAR